MSERLGTRQRAIDGRPCTAGAANQDALLPFLLGAAVGGVAGAVVGTVLSQHTTHLIATMVAVIDRRLHEADRERLKFELLLQ